MATCATAPLGCGGAAAAQMAGLRRDGFGPIGQMYRDRLARFLADLTRRVEEFDHSRAARPTVLGARHPALTGCVSGPGNGPGRGRATGAARSAPAAWFRW